MNSDLNQKPPGNLSCPSHFNFPHCPSFLVFNFHGPCINSEIHSSIELGCVLSIAALLCLRATTTLSKRWQSACQIDFSREARSIFDKSRWSSYAVSISVTLYLQGIETVCGTCFVPMHLHFAQNSQDRNYLKSQTLIPFSFLISVFPDPDVRCLQQPQRLGEPAAAGGGVTAALAERHHPLCVLRHVSCRGHVIIGNSCCCCCPQPATAEGQTSPAVKFLRVIIVSWAKEPGKQSQCQYKFKGIHTCKQAASNVQIIRIPFNLPHLLVYIYVCLLHFYVSLFIYPYSPRMSCSWNFSTLTPETPSCTRSPVRTPRPRTRRSTSCMWAGSTITAGRTGPTTSRSKSEDREEDQVMATTSEVSSGDTQHPLYPTHNMSTGPF